ncbi:MAG: YfhO family protein [Nitrospirae bacterium]|nr:YfhO family protein [Nitrospirota bacterium]
MNKFRDFFIDETDGSLNNRFYILLFFVLTHVFFWKFLVPGNFAFSTDTMGAAYPVQKMAVDEMLSTRSLMLWNPYIFAGMPFLASFSFPFFYPGSLLFFVLPYDFSMSYVYVLHTFLMGCFMFAFLRHTKLSRQASFVGGLLFMFAAHYISLIYPGHGGKIFTITYLPLGLLFLDRGLDEKPFYNMTLMGLMVGLMFYASHVQILFYCGITLLFFFLFRVAAGVRSNGIKWAGRGALGFGYAFLLGIMLYAVILVPAWEYRGHTERKGGIVGASSYEFATSFSQPPEDMLYLLLRNPFGWGKDYGPLTPTTSDPFYKGRIGLRLSIDYLSVFGAVLALIALFFRRNIYTKAFFGLALLAAFLALGGFNPLYYYVYKLVPGFSIFRVPYAIMILIPLAVAVMSAQGMQYLLDADEARTGGGLMKFILAGCGALVVMLAVSLYFVTNPASVTSWLLGFETVREMLWGEYGDLMTRFGFFMDNVLMFLALLAVSLVLLFVYRRGILGVKYLTLAVSAFILADLWSIGWEFIKVVPTSSIESVYFRESPEIKYMKADKGGQFRVFSLVTNNELLYHRIQALTGYHAANLENINKLLETINFGNSTLDLLNARYLMLPKEPQYDFLNYPEPEARAELAKKYELLDDTEIYFYRNKTAAPRAYLVSDLWRLENDNQALTVLADRRFVPAQVAVVTEDVGGDAPFDQGADLTAQRVSITAYEADRMELDVSSPANSFMVISEVWYPGWKAYVDGKETQVYRTDYALRGIAMPAGEHKVVMEFSPATFKVGAAMSITALLFLAGVVLLPVYRKKGIGAARQRLGSVSMFFVRGIS